MKQVEYVLLTAFTGAVGVACGGMLWPALSQLATVFTQIAQALQVKP
jgi:Flp pilus assembly pilin Flp